MDMVVVIIVVSNAKFKVLQLWKIMEDRAREMIQICPPSFIVFSLAHDKQNALKAKILRQ